MIKINKKVVVSSLFAGIFITLFTGYIGNGIPLGWYYAQIDWAMYIGNVIIWGIVAFILINVFMKYKIPF